MAASLFSLPRVDRSANAWQSRSLRSILTPRSERNRPDLPLLTVARERGVFVRSDDDANHNSIPEDLGNYKVARSGDLVINKMKAWQGSLGLAPVDGIVSPAYFVFEADFDVPRYGEYLLRSKPYVAKFGAASDGVRIGQWDLNIPRMRNIEVSLPQAEEQSAIVKYLAHANARIDKAIVAKRRLNALLREQSDLRHDAIVLGIEPTSDRLASVNTWFGDAPSGWAVEPLRARYHQQLGKMLSGKVSSGDYMRPYLRNVDVQWNSINADDLPEMNIPPSEEDRYTARQGDVLVCEGGDVGRAAIWERETPIAFQKALHRLRVISSERDDPRFLVAALRVAKRSGAFSSGRVSTIQHLTGDQIRRHRFAWPPIEEQLAIAEAISDLQAASDATATKIEREIALLLEFRTRLIADVVTGQVDVRAIAESLPDAPEQDADLDALLDDDLEDVLGEGEE